jgi:spore coat protein CotH
MPTAATRRSRVYWSGPAIAAVLCVVSLVCVGCGSLAEAATTQPFIDQSSTTQATQETTVVTSSAETSATVTPSTTAGAGPFDSSIVHDLTVSFDQAEYDAMIDTYQSTGEKDWIEATVTIDGATYNNVGIRLKGNSSIRGLRGGDSGGPTGGPGSNSSADKPEGLPWLIRLDKNVDGQSHDGVVDFVVRSNTSKTSLNEAVSLELLQLAGLQSLKAVAVRFSVNGSEAALRLVTELPNDDWMAVHFDSGGALYKADASGDYSYRGDDPSSYDQVFEQEAGKNNADLSPLVDFLDFINNADDATFNAELANHLDIDSFATYLAMEQLIGNFDDIDGPGNNSYLYYDPATGVFTVVPWDHNLAFGGFGGGAQAGGAGVAAGGGNRGNGQVGNGQVGGGQDAGGQFPRGGGRGKSNVLVERFHANPEFEELYQQKVTDLTGRLYESGVATDILAEWVTLLETQASDLVDSSTVRSEASKIARYFTAQ